jgi:hypothetical protein
MSNSGNPGQGLAIPTTMGWLREGMNGLVVLASGILTFSAGFYKDLTLSTFPQKMLFAFSAIALLVTIVCGILCAFWLNRYVNLRENESPQQAVPAESARGKDPQAREMPLEMQNAKRWYYFYYYATLVAFCLGMALITGLVLVGISSATSSARKDCQPSSLTVQSTATPLRYSFGTSAQHAGFRGRIIQHTFLLDQYTGQVWQMFCRKDGQQVEFRKIDVEGIPNPNDKMKFGAQK